MLNFYDYEVFKYDWLVVIINPFEESKTVIVNDKDQLKAYYDAHKDQIWIGYNSRSYDQYIQKAILLGFDPKEVNDFIILKQRKGWEFSSLFNRIPLYNYDTMNSYHSLKTLEGFMGNDMRETSVPFDIDRKLTPEEIANTVKYCTHDVEQTMEVFIQTKNEFDAQMGLLNTFNLPLNNIGKTQAQLAAIILNAKRVNLFDDWDIRMPETLDLHKYLFVADWFLNKENHDESSTLTCDIAGVSHVVAWGGLHGALPQYNYTCKDDELLIMADVDQLYPTLMIVYRLLSRAVTNYDKFEHILAESLRLKKLKMKKKREPYKRICNITYGCEGDPNNAMYDPLHRKLVCVFGQVLMIDLIEKIEPFCQLIQSNTDGILILIKDKDFDRLDDVVYQWEQRTGLHMSFDIFKTIFQKDVNNYLAIDQDGEIKRKGAWLKKLNNLDNDLPIINEALVQYMVKGVPVEDTIYGCDHLREFQKIVKVSSKYICGWHNHQKLQDKTFRVFASKDQNDTIIGKVKLKNGQQVVEKFANTPEHCFIWNAAVNFVDVPEKLDKKYYVDIAKARLKAFGI